MRGPTTARGAGVPAVLRRKGTGGASWTRGARSQSGEGRRSAARRARPVWRAWFPGVTAGPQGHETGNSGDLTGVSESGCLVALHAEALRHQLGPNLGI